MQGHELPHSKRVLIFVLIADMLNTVLREIISLSSPDESDQRAAGIATVVFFVLVLVILAVTISIVNIISICIIEDDAKIICFELLVLLFDIFGAVLYFYGDNIGFVFSRYGDVLGCGPQCVENNRIAAILILGCALIYLHLGPPCINKISDLMGIKHESVGWYSASDMITTILKIDAVFTVVAIMAQTTDFCSTTDKSISLAFLIICILVGIVLMIVYCTSSAIELSDDSDTEDWFWFAPFAFVILAISFPMYVLADNAQPLDCAWGCDSFASNLTINDLTCDNVGNSAIRLGFTLVTALTVGILSLVLFGCRLNTESTSDATAKTV